MTAHQANASLKADLNRAIPVAIIVFAAVVGSLFVLRYNGEKYLRRDLYERGDAITVASILSESATARMRTLRERVARLRKQELTASAAAATRDAAGLLKGDPVALSVQRDLNRALDLMPQMAAHHLDLAEVALWLGDRGLSHRHRARYALGRGEPGEALIEARLALEADPTDPLTTALLGEALLANGQREEATALVAAQRKLLEASNDGIAFLARAEVEAGNLRPAEEYALRALESRPNDRALIDVLARALDGQGDVRRTAETFAKAARFPNAVDASVPHRAALVFEKLGDLDAAEREMLEARRMAPRNVYVLVDLAGIQWKRGRVAEARQTFSQAIEISPDIAVDQRRARGLNLDQPPPGR